jgi:hypothetical protein
MATGTFLDTITEWNAKSAVVIKDLALRGDFETASLLSSLRTTANDENLTQEVRLNALTALINRGELLDIPVPPYYPVAFSFAPTVVYTGLHNDLDGLNTGDYWHLTFAQYLSVLNKANISDITFGNLTGEVSDNAKLVTAFSLKEDAIPTGTAGQFFGWDKTMRFVNWSDLASKPTTLSGLGISSGDTLFDGKYLSQSSIITSYVLGANSSVSNTDTLVGAIGKLQAQINNVASTGGTINTVGITMTDVFTVGNSPLTGSGGTINFTLQSQSAKTFFAAPNAGSGNPNFREIIAEDLPLSGVSEGTYGNTTNWPTFTVDAYGRITSISTQAATSGGTVTSVALSAPIEFTVSGSPVIDDGTLGFSWQPQIANYVLAGPESGASAAPSFRQLVVADLPLNIPIDNIDGLQGELDARLSDGLGNSLIFMGNGSNKAVQTLVDGDLSASFSVVGTENTGTFTIVDEAVTYAKFQNIPDSALTLQRPILLGRFDAGQGVMQQMTLSGDFTINTTSGQIGLTVPNTPSLVDVGDLLTSTGSNNLVRLPVGGDGYLLMPYAAATTPACGLIWGEVGGDISYTVDDTTTPGTPFGAFSIGANKVTLDKIEQIGLNTILGNNTANPDNVAALTATEVTAMLDTFGTAAKGLTPAASFTPDPGKFLVDYSLRADGTWVLGGGGSGNPGGSPNQIQYNNGGTSFGGVADMEFLSGTGVYATASKFFLTNSASAKNVSINFNLTALGNDYTWAFPDDGSTFVGTDIGQTLTNKTLGTNTAIDIGTNAIGTMWYTNSSGLLSEINPTGNDGKYLKLVSGIPSWQGVSVTSTANIDGGLANQILYQTAPGTTGFIAVPTTANTYLKWNGSAIVWDTAGSGSGTVVSGAQYNLAYYSDSPTGTTVSALGSLGTANQVLHGNASGLPTWSAVDLTADVTGTLPASKGGTGVNSYTAGDLLYAGSTGSISTLTKLGVGSIGQILTVGVGASLTWTSGLTNPMTTAGDMIIATTLGAAIRLGIGSTGDVLTVVSGAPAWAAPAPQNTTLNNVTASTGTSSILHGNFPIQWNWNSNTTGNALILNSTGITTGVLFSVTHSGSAFAGTGLASFTSTGITTGNLLNLGISGSTATSADNLLITNSSTANTSGRGLDISITGITNSGSTFGAVISNTKTGTTSTNTALQLTASGGTTNYALDVTAGVVRLPATSATVPHILFQPGAAALTATTNGMLSYATESSNSSFYLYKDTGVTKLITLDRNPDFALVGTPGVIVSDASGTLSKNADLTALGVLATYSTYTLTTTATNIFSTVSLVGSTILPANFFGVGKTIVVFLSGQYTSGGGASTISLTLAFGTTYSQLFTVTVHPTVVVASYWEARITITCSVSGATGTLRTMATAIANDSGSGGTAKLTQLTLQLASSFNTTIANTISLNANYAGATTAATIDMCQIYYLN